MLRKYIENNITGSSIVLFVIIFILINTYKPGFLYNSDGSLREFGLNNTKKTIIPVWLLTLIISMICYVVILYYVSIPKMTY